VSGSIIHRFHHLRTAPGDVALCHLGQQSFILKFGETTVFVDPYLTPCRGRLVAPFFKPEDVVGADIVSGSHDHSDHIDRLAWPAIAAASPKACFVVPEAVRDSVIKETGIAAQRITGLNDGGCVEVNGVRISAVAAAHEFLDYNPATGLYPYLGYIFESNGVTVYHAGDSCIYEGLQTKLKKWTIDIALLPINGRDAVRLRKNCIGNMTYQEAADLAGALSPKLTIPTHYDMFAMNSLDPRLFIDYMKVKYPRLKCARPRLGTIFRWSSNSHYGSRTSRMQAKA
jgi:L-ascorbate metabolism protein UlaG (beta-lactamase superfamily)